MKKLIFLVLLSFVFVTCTKTDPSANYDTETPIKLSTSIDNYGSPSFPNQEFNLKARLGRVLFYDKKLSHNNTIACASCHKQNLGFADNKAFSSGFSGMKTLRNSIHLGNTGGFLFWDARENDLDKMTVLPILNHIEMGINDIDDVILRIEKFKYYNDLFKEAFGDNLITKERIGEALAKFVSSIRLSDEFNKKRSSLSMSEGAKVFHKYQCFSCHNEAGSPSGWWGGSSIANTGLDIDNKDIGAGASPQFKNEKFEGAFKVPSLFNVAKTAPYMHDGRFANLDQVLDHYSDNIQPNKNLDFRLREGFDPFNFRFSSKQSLIEQIKAQSGSGIIIPLRAKITSKDRKILIDFLNSLTDDQMLNDKRFSNPFVN